MEEIGSHGLKPRSYPYQDFHLFPVLKAIFFRNHLQNNDEEKQAVQQFFEQQGTQF